MSGAFAVIAVIAVAVVAFFAYRYYRNRENAPDEQDQAACNPDEFDWNACHEWTKWFIELFECLGKVVSVVDAVDGQDNKDNNAGVYLNDYGYYSYDPNTTTSYTEDDNPTLEVVGAVI